MDPQVEVAPTDAYATYAGADPAAHHDPYTRITTAPAPRLRESGQTDTSAAFGVCRISNATRARYTTEGRGGGSDWGPDAGGRVPVGDVGAEAFSRGTGTSSAVEAGPAHARRVQVTVQ